MAPDLLLAQVENRLAVEALAELNPVFIQDIPAELPAPRRETILDSASVELVRQWRNNQAYADDTLGRLMEPAYVAFGPDTAPASSIFLTTATDIVGMGMLPGLATLLAPLNRKSQG